MPNHASAATDGRRQPPAMGLLTHLGVANAPGTGAKNTIRRGACRRIGLTPVEMRQRTALEKRRTRVAVVVLLTCLLAALHAAAPAIALMPRLRSTVATRAACGIKP